MDVKIDGAPESERAPDDGREGQESGSPAAKKAFSETETDIAVKAVVERALAAIAGYGRSREGEPVNTGVPFAPWVKNAPGGVEEAFYSREPYLR